MAEAVTTTVPSKPVTTVTLTLTELEARVIRKLTGRCPGFPANEAEQAAQDIYEALSDFDNGMSVMLPASLGGHNVTCIHLDRE